MKAPLSATVLVSAGRHPLSGIARACRGDAIALAAGQALAGSTLRVIHAGDVSEPALRDYLAYGATCIDVIPVCDASGVLPALKSALADCDLILTGTRSETAAASGQLPYALAEALDRPIVPNVLEISQTGGALELRQFLPKGKRRKVSVGLPAILTIHPLADVALKYAYTRRLCGRIEKLPGADQDTVSAPIDVLTWTVTQTGRPLQRLKAEERKPAHARLQSALGGETKRGVVVSEGSDSEKARALLAYLRDNKLVDF